MSSPKTLTVMLVMVIAATAAIWGIDRVAKTTSNTDVLEPFVDDPVFTAAVPKAVSDEVRHGESVKPTFMFPTSRRPEYLVRILKFENCLDAKDALSILEDTINVTYGDATQTGTEENRREWHWIDKRSELSRLDISYYPDECSVWIDLQATA